MVDNVPEARQEKFLDLKNDSAARRLPECGTGGVLDPSPRDMSASCSKRSAGAGPIVVYVYLCETGFSALMHLKTKSRNKLNLEADLCCALSMTTPDTEGLVSQKKVPEGTLKCCLVDRLLTFCDSSLQFSLLFHDDNGVLP